MKLNEIDKDGYFVVDYVEGDLPLNWTADLVGDGYYKAQYTNATVNEETGEWTNGTWIETSGPSTEDLLTEATNKYDSLKSEIQTATYTLNLKLAMGRKLTDSETETLNKWLDYADALNALDLSTAPDINWPAVPNQ